MFAFTLVPEYVLRAWHAARLTAGSPVSVTFDTTVPTYSISLLQGRADKQLPWPENFHMHGGRLETTNEESIYE